MGKCPVLLCDRGLLDGKAYAGKENWDRMLKSLNVNIKLRRLHNRKYIQDTKLSFICKLPPMAHNKHTSMLLIKNNNQKLMIKKSKVIKSEDKLLKP